MTLYDDLGVDPDTSPEELKKAYKSKASKCHPDKGGNEEDFKQIQKAYSILSDPEKKKRYEETGQTSNTQNIRVAAVQLLGGLFLQISEQNHFVHKNYIPQVRKILVGSLTKDKQTLAHFQKMHKNVLYMSKHIQGESDLGQLFENKAANIMQQHNQCSDHMKILDLSIVLLDRCTYSGEEIVEPSQIESSFSWYTGGA